MAADTNWKPAYDASLTYNGAARPCETVEYSDTVGTFETTTNVSQGAYEFGVDITTIALRWSEPIDDDTPTMAPFKSLVAFSYSDGIETVSGKARVTSRSRSGGAKGGYKISYQATATGAVTRT